MKVPKRINELLDLRIAYIEAQEGRLDKTIMSYQQELLTKLTTDVITALDVDNAGNIRETRKNYRLLQMLEKTYRDFTKNNRYSIGDDIRQTVAEIALKTNNYFTTVLLDDFTESALKEAIKGANDFVNLQLGLGEKRIIAGGFLDNLIRNEELLLQLKQFTSQAITGRMPKKDYIKEMNRLVVGNKTTQGGHERIFNRYARDMYSSYDAAYNKTLADRLGMKWFIYSGGLVRDSRDFCVAHNAKVYSVDEAAEWKTWTINKAIKADEFPAGYKIQEKPERWGQTPGYMSFPEYSPVHHRGGYNCRHILGYISERLAMRMRPGIKKEVLNVKK